MMRSTRPMHPTTRGMLEYIANANKRGTRPTGYAVTGFSGGRIAGQTRNGRYNILRRLEREGLIQDLGGAVSAWEMTVDGIMELYGDDWD